MRWFTCLSNISRSSTRRERTKLGRSMSLECCHAAPLVVNMPSPSSGPMFFFRRSGRWNDLKSSASMFLRISGSAVTITLMPNSASWQVFEPRAIKLFCVFSRAICSLRTFRFAQMKSIPKTRSLIGNHLIGLHPCCLIRRRRDPPIVICRYI